MAELNVYTVTSTADTATNPAQGTLRYGLVNAVANSYDKIVFDSTVFPANTQTTILLAAQLEAPARDLIIDGGATWTVNYVWRGEGNNKTRVFIDENNPAQEGEEIKTLLRTRVVLDAQAKTYRCLIGAAANKINVSGVTFKRGKLSGSSYGAGVHTRNSAASGKNAFTDCTFDSCAATNGGGLYSYNTSQNTLENCTFDRCTAATNGGGLCSTATSQNTLENCTFDSCAATYGGGLCSTATSQNTLENCTFDSCAATNGGGLCLQAASSVLFRTSYDDVNRFVNCEATTSGSAIYNNSFYQFDFNDGIVYTDCEPVNAWNKADQTIRYFSNNADSGTGSLRQAISDASNYDIIEPDPTAFANVDVVEIELSSPIAFNKKLTFRGNGKRVRLNGQKAYRIGNATQAIQFEDYDFVNGYSVSANTGAVFHVTGGYSQELTRCLVAGNYGAKVVYANGNSSFVLKSSVMIGNQVNTDGLFANVTQVFIGSTVICNCIVGGASYQFTSGVDNSLETMNALLADFVDAPPLSMPVWDADAWKAWDLRLAADSPYLHGASPKLLDDPNTAFDFFGRQRKLNGAIGAIEGSWLVVSEDGTSTTGNTTVDYAEIGDGATLAITDGAVVTIRDVATFGEATIASENGAYLAVPAGTELSAATLTNINVANGVVENVAVAVTVNARTATIRLTPNVPGAYFEYKPVGATAFSPLTVSNGQATISDDRAFVVRAFTGAFATSEVVPRVYYYQGDAETGSFATASDWAMDSARTLTCNATPTISGCTFECR